MAAGGPDGTAATIAVSAAVPSGRPARARPGGTAIRRERPAASCPASSASRSTVTRDREVAQQPEGYGFITPADGGKDLFVHRHSAIAGKGFKSLEKGANVDYEVKQGPSAANERAI